MSLFPITITSPGTLVTSGVSTTAGQAPAIEALVNGAQNTSSNPFFGQLVAGSANIGVVELAAGTSVEIGNTLLAVAGLEPVGGAITSNPVAIAGADVSNLKRTLQTDAAGVLQTNQVMRSSQDRSVGGVQPSGGSLIYAGATLTPGGTIAANPSRLLAEFQNQGSSVAALQVFNPGASSFTGFGLAPAQNGQGGDWYTRGLGEIVIWGNNVAATEYF